MRPPRLALPHPAPPVPHAAAPHATAPASPAACHRPPRRPRPRPGRMPHPRASPASCAPSGRALVKGKRGGARKVALVRAASLLPARPLQQRDLGAAGPSAASPRSGGTTGTALMLPIAVSLLTASVANRGRAPEAAPGVGPAAAACVRLVGEGRLPRWRSPSPRTSWCWPPRSLPGMRAPGAPSLPAGLAICVFLTLASAWMVPAGLALATRLERLRASRCPPSCSWDAA